MTDIIMPKAGMAMETGKIVRWLVSEGDQVSAGDMILEIETDKVNMEVEAFASGTILKLLAKEGDVLPVTQVIGYIGQPGEKIPDAPTAAAAAEAMPKQAQQSVEKVQAGTMQLSRGKKIPATPLAKTLCEQRGINIADVTPSGFFGEVKAKDVPDAVKCAKVTPLAKAIAKDHGIDLGSISAKGRIYASDVQAMMQSAKDAQTKQVALMDGDQTQALNGMRKTIARRMHESHIEVPPVTLHTKADVTGLLAHRKQTNAAGGEKISINDYIIEACAMTLKEMPEANISFGGDCVIQRKHVNIGVAVAIDGGGLIVPVIKDADTMDITGLSKTMKALAKKARQGALMPDDYTGGTFTISNLGMFGITFFTPIINQPESMILGVNAIEKTLSMDDEGKLYNHDIMGLSLTFDHRAHDGAGAALFLKSVVEKLERFNKEKVQ